MGGGGRPGAARPYRGHVLLDDALADPAQRDRPHPAVAAGEGSALLLAAGRVPDPHRAVAAAGDDDIALADPAHRHRHHPVDVAGEYVVRGANAVRPAWLEPLIACSREPFAELGKPRMSGCRRPQSRPPRRRQLGRWQSEPVEEDVCLGQGGTGEVEHHGRPAWSPLQLGS